MRRYNQRLYRLAGSVMGDASEAEDVLQESYVRAFYAFATYTGAGSLGAWLARIVRNEAIDRVRARESRRSHVAIEADLGGQSGEDETNVTIDPLMIDSAGARRERRATVPWNVRSSACRSSSAPRSCYARSKDSRSKKRPSTSASRPRR